MPGSCPRFIAVLAVAALACGPGEPPPSVDPTNDVPDAGDTADDAGGGGGAGDAAGDAGGDGGGAGPDAGEKPGAQGGATAWVDVLGGAGAEHVEDVVAAPDGGVVALTAIGVRAASLDAVGIVRISAGGTELGARALEVRAPVSFAPGGALAAAPQGHLFLALDCPEGCPALAADSRGALLVRLTGAGEVAWSFALPGGLVSNVAAGSDGAALVATRQDSRTVLWKVSGDGALLWGLELEGARDRVAVAAAGSGAALGTGGDVSLVDAAGRRLWARALGADVALAAVGVAGASVFAAGTSAGGVAAAGPGAFVARLEDGALASARGLPGSPGELLLAVAPAGRVAVVSGAEGCAATVAVQQGDAVEWSRPVAAGACGGRDLSVHGVAVISSGAVVVGGALRDDVDLGEGRERPSATDGFVAAMGP